MSAKRPKAGPRTVHVPDHVVARELSGQTVLLNLETGRYHGLNAVAAAMFDLLSRHGDIERIPGELTERFGASTDRIRHDLEALCLDLEARGLLEIHAEG